MGGARIGSLDHLRHNYMCSFDDDKTSHECNQEHTVNESTRYNLVHEDVTGIDVRIKLIVI